MCFVGMLVMSFMISEFAALFISYIWNEVDYRKNQIAVELYLDRIRVSRELKQRTQRFMSSLWSSHSGVNYEAILTDLPESIRSDAVIHIVHRPLRLFASSTFRLLACDSRPDLDALTHKLAQSLRFEGYPRDENVVSEGSISRGMFFVVRGHLVMSSLSNAQMPRSIIRKGQYFGDRGLLGCVVSAFTVRTVRSCDLLSLSSEAFLKVLEQNAFSDLALTVTKRAQQRLTERAAAECSREEMEGHWGKVLLTELRMVQQSLDTSRDTRLSRTHIDQLVITVQDAADCMRIFQSFLGVVLPFDPLDWTAAVGNVLAKRHAQSPASALWMEPPFSLGPADTLSDTAHHAAMGETPAHITPRRSRLTATDGRRINLVSASDADAASALTGMTQPPTIGDTTTNPITADKVNVDDTESLMSEILDALTAPPVGADSDQVATASNAPT
jgi:CRP-like cAMP-binding protein